MKKIIVYLIFLCCISCNSQEHTDLKRNEGGLFEIECTLNNKVFIPFYLDMGASETVIPYHVFLTLVKSGTVVREDMLPSRNYILADGSSITSYRFLLCELKIGTKTFYDIPVSIAENNSAPCLIGQSTLERFGVIMIDYENNLLIYE